VVQEGGPSNGGGAVTPRREVARTDSPDAGGDALADYSSLAPGSSNPTNVPAMDFTSQSIGPELNLDNGQEVKDGGFTATLKLADLSDGALQNALSETGSGSLLWIFRFVNGYQASAAVARWTPAGGFSFGYNDYTTASANCGSNGEKCQQFPGDQPLQGKVDQATGTIQMSVPRSYLNGLNGPTGPNQRPTLDKAHPGTCFYDAAGFSLGNVSAEPTTQTFLYPIDNPPAMDFALPGVPAGEPDECKQPQTATPTGNCLNPIKGTKGKDRLKGTSGEDRIRGRKGKDRIKGRGGDDCLSGQAGKDRVSGGAGGDDIKGGRGKDRLKGGGGRDKIHARRGARDIVNCGPGKDVAIVNKKRDKVRKNCEKVRGHK
jgi:Ca2+-binding RTX toxin-like protein